MSIFSPGNVNTIQFRLGNFLQSASVLGPQILLLSEMIIYITLYKSNKIHNDHMKDTETIGKRSLHARYRKNTITLSGQMLSFFTKIVLYILAFVLLKFRKSLNMDNLSFNHCVNIVMRAFIGISLIVASPELRREYFGNNEFWIKKRPNCIWILNSWPPASPRVPK